MRCFFNMMSLRTLGCLEAHLNRRFGLLIDQQVHEAEPLRFSEDNYLAKNTFFLLKDNNKDKVIF